MNGYKSIFMSVTFWGTVLTTFSLLFPNIYTKIGITDQSVVVAHIVGVIGGGIALWGRLRATKVVTITGAPPAGKPLGIPYQ